MTDSLSLADLVASRLCHDLVGPAGAVAAGLELLDDPSGVDPEAMDLIRMSAAQLNNRLAFFRLAFGKADAGSVGLADVRRILERFHGETVEVHWHDAVGLQRDSLPRAVARMLMQATMVAQSAILRNSAISTQIAGTENGIALGILAEGEGGRMDEAMVRILTGAAGEADLTPALLPALMLARSCDRHNCDLQFDPREGETEIAIMVPGFI